LVIIIMGILFLVGFWLNLLSGTLSFQRKTIKVGIIL
jgi:hypothetical protein